MSLSSRLLVRLAAVLLCGLSAMTLAGCSGSGTTGVAQVRCANGNSFCLVSCDLGCGATVCSVTEVAENQRLQFVFNQPIDPASIHGSSFSLRTVTGEAPDGQVVVDGATITFVPTISVSNGVSSFGFRRNESYVITLLGASQQGIRTASGTVLPASYSCTVTATLGIIDEDNSPPIATLTAPTNVTAAPVGSTIVLRFSEVVDTTPFLVPVSPSTPIRYVLKRSRIPVGGTERECNIDSEPIQIDGLPRVGLEFVNGRPVSTISLKPTLTLPGLSCVEIVVTSDVRDLAGRGAQEATFRFLTEQTASVETNIIEDFVTEGRMDTTVSGGTWQNGAIPALVGGDGRHGTFVPNNGGAPTSGVVDLGGNIFEWNTESITFPSSQTFNGQDQLVTNGEWFFTDLLVPDGVTIRFKGTRVPQIHVRGRVEIRGRIQANGATLGNFNCRNPLPNNPGQTHVAGQAGAAGGPGGGRGGQGGDRSWGTPIFPPPPAPQPPASWNPNGRPGEDVQLRGGHAYQARAIGTGGPGSPIWPLHGNDTLLTGPPTTYTISAQFNSSINAGGGGGGYFTAGNPGIANQAPPPAPVINRPTTPNPGGIAISLLPLPAPAPSSLEHFLVGGSGGGGGGSHPYVGLQFTQQNFVNDRWKAGGGGTGGGGAVAIRGGRDIAVPPSGLLESKGGTGATINGDNPTTTTVVEGPTTSLSWGICAPGGGGSGGTYVLQADRNVQIEGRLDMAGGLASRTAQIAVTNPNVVCDTRGGDGAPGSYRLEARGLVQVSGTNNMPAFDPAVHSGVLTDRDSASGCRSLWRSTGMVFPPEWLRYEMQVDLDGNGTVDQVYSDDPAVAGSIGPATDPLGPVTVKFQGARVSAAGEPVAGTIRPWRDFIFDGAGLSLNGDSVTGFRFQILFNVGAFPAAVVKRLMVVVRGS